MFEYEIGGNERKVETSESIVDISFNKTMFIQKLTDNEPLRPEKVEGLKKVDDVFAHFKPNVDVSFEDEDGAAVNENLKFQNLGDFSAKNLTQQSDFLSNISVQKDLSASVIKQLKSNKTLKSAIENAETKEAFINVLKNFIAELEANK
ncbi:MULTISPECIES: type VI secretion system contractile sheath small subunit [Sphingobacterium]|uniref:Type VI secretion system (T6SS) VipA/Hcp2 family protein n=2 Tax=Sphingobacterium TaxID=28453 RepID=A0A420BFK7_SPHD1|nr:MULTISPECIES: type VI secretion system contractile sheath small subunit [Sphingobacterium]MCS4225971.1 putative component of type VI protein secretion system [Sphingobacterium sp. BIGb0165]RKE55473.1 type VI secretion system (T6SS) VipA/Hcp2 family protein [Sphingobacterium detergens]